MLAFGGLCDSNIRMEIMTQAAWPALPCLRSLLPPGRGEVAQGFKATWRHSA